MKRILLGLGVVIVLLIGAALVVPSFIDWNAHKTTIAEQAQDALGRELRIDGDLSLKVLPLPTASVSGVSLSNAPGTQEPFMVQAEKVDVRLALLPLLMGKVEVDHVLLVKPQVHLEVTPDGVQNWNFTPPSEPQGEQDASETQASSAPTEGNAESDGPAADALSLNQVLIQDGLVTYRDAGTGVSETVSDITLDAALGSLVGPFQLSGHLTAKGQALKLEAHVAGIGEGRATPLDVSLSTANGGADVAVKGLLSGLEGNKLGFRGSFSLGSQNLSLLNRFAGFEGSAEAGLPSVPFRLEGDVVASEEAIEAPEIALQLGSSQGTGRLALDMGDLTAIDAAFALATVSLDELLAPAPSPQAMTAPSSTPPAGAPAESGNPAGSNQASSEAPAAPFALPQDIKANLDVTVEGLRYQGKDFEQGRLNLIMEEGRIGLRQASLTGPGQAEASVRGWLLAHQDKPYIDMEIKAKAESLRETLSGAGVALGTLPEGRLQGFSFSGKAVGSLDQLALTGMTGHVDDTTMQGAATLRLEGRPAFGATIKLGRIDADGYGLGATSETTEAKANPTEQGAQKATTAETKAVDAVAPAKPADPLFAPLAGLKDFDANLDISVEGLRYNGLDWSGLGFKGTLVNGVLAIEQAAVKDVAGARLSASGGVSGFGGAPQMDDLSLHFVSTAPDKLASAFDLPLPEPVLAMGKVALSATLTGDLQKSDVKSRFEGGGILTQANGVVRDPLRALSADLALQASHADFGRFMRLFSPDYRPGNRNLGSFALTGDLKGQGGQFDIENLRVRAGSATAGGRVGVDLLQILPFVSFDLTAGEINLDDFLPAQGGTQRGEGGYRDPFAPRQGLSNIAFKPTAASQSEQVAAVSGAPWSDEPIDLSVLQSLNAKGTLSASKLIASGYPLTDVKGAIGLQDGLAQLESLTAQLFGGAFSAKGHINAAQAKPMMAATLSAENANVKQALLGLAEVGVADGLASFTFDMKTQGASSRALIASLNGTGGLQVRNGVFEGVDLDAVNRELADTRNSAGLIRMVQQALNGGRTRFDALDATVQVQGGVARSNDFVLNAQAGQGTAQGAVDLANWTVDAKAGFVFQATKGAPPVGLRLSGPLDNPKKVFDINAFQKFVIANTLSNIIKNDGKLDAGDLIRGILGGGGQAQPQPQQQPAPQQDQGGGWGDYSADGNSEQKKQEEQQQQNPGEQLLRGLLKGLGN